MYKVIGADQKEYGPVSQETLLEWISQGRVNAQTLAQAEGTTGWQPLAAFPEFAAALAARPSVARAPVAASAGSPKPKTSGMAVTSLVLGVLGFFNCAVTALPGLILGIIAQSRIRRSAGQLEGSGLAIAGIVTSAMAGIVTFAVVLLLVPIPAGLMLSALANAKEKAQAIYCVNNMKQLGLGVLIYAADNDDQFPPAATWCDAIQNDVGNVAAFQCKALPGQSCAYAYNQQLDGKKTEDVDPQTVLLFESDAGWNASGGFELLTAHKHSTRTVNVAFADGSVRRVPRAELATLRWEP